MLLLCLIFGLAFASPGWAESETQAPSPTAPRAWEIAPQISVVSVSGLRLPTPGFSVNYIPTFVGLPTFNVTLLRNLWSDGVFSIAAQASLGFGSRSAKFETQSLSSLVTQPEELTLRWIPLSISSRWTYRSPRFAYLRPGLVVGIGALALSQNSSRPGLSQLVGIPMLLVSPQITFMDSGSDHWLGGFTFGWTMMRGIGGSTGLAASSLDLSLNLHL